MIHRPYLQVTLSTKPLGLEVGPKGRNVTCQYVRVRRRKSKPAPGTDTSAAAPIAGSDKTSKTIEGARAGPESAIGNQTVDHKGDKATKRKAASRQSSEATRGGKKRKK